MPVARGSCLTGRRRFGDLNYRIDLERQAVVDMAMARAVARTAAAPDTETHAALAVRGCSRVRSVLD
jgi:hypothetical protein